MLGLELDLALLCACKKDEYLVFCLLHRYSSTVSRFGDAARRREQKKLFGGPQSKAFVQCHD